MPGADPGSPCLAGKPGIAQISIRTKEEKGKHTGYTTQGGSVSGLSKGDRVLTGSSDRFLVETEKGSTRLV